MPLFSAECITLTLRLTVRMGSIPKWNPSPWLINYSGSLMQLHVSMPTLGNMTRGLTCVRRHELHWLEHIHCSDSSLLSQWISIRVAAWAVCPGDRETILKDIISGHHSAISWLFQSLRHQPMVLALFLCLGQVSGTIQLTAREIHHSLLTFDKIHSPWLLLVMFFLMAPIHLPSFSIFLIGSQSTNAS